MLLRSLPALLLCCSGCTPEPVVSGVQPPRQSVEQITEQRRVQELRASPQNLIATYKKPEGVYIDARYFGGRNYDQVRDQLTDQMGALQDSEDLGWQGKEMVFERASVRVKDGAIYMISVPLPEALRRTETLGVLGFPPAARDYIDLTHEYRLNNAWSFRRIRFIKVSPQGEEIQRVELWKTEPEG